jgi:hypothetical protein
MSRPYDINSCNYERFTYRAVIDSINQTLIPLNKVSSNKCSPENAFLYPGIIQIDGWLYRCFQETMIRKKSYY